MTNRSLRLALVLLICVVEVACRRRHGGAGAAPGLHGDLATLRDRALTLSRASDHVRSLTNEVGPRLAGSAGDPKAVAWAVATMSALGFANVHAEKVMVPRWVRGVESGQIVSPVQQPLVLTALGGSVATPEGGLEAEVIEVDSLQAVDALPREKVEGRIVFYDKIMERTHDGSGYGKAVDVRSRGWINASKKGAVGVLIRSVGTTTARFPHTGAMRAVDDVPRIPSAALAIPDAELLHRTLATGKAVRVRFTLGCRQLDDAESANVIGEVVGRERPDEIVLIGAHLDSWDLGTGALDDGAGIAVVLEAARLIKELPRPPRRTVRVVLFANEENGLRGALEYARAHHDELGKHLLAFESDGGCGKVEGISYLAGPSADASMHAITSPLAALSVAPARSREVHGADVSPLRAAGVPVLDLNQDASRYFDFHHTPDDTFDKIEPKSLDQVAASAAILAFGAAELAGDFGRIPEEKRK